MQASSKRLGEILIEKGVITEQQLQDALKEQKASGEFLGTIMINRGMISKVNLSEALAEQFGIPLVELKQQNLDMDVLHRFSSSLILDYQCFPIKEDEDSVTVAIVNPLNAVVISKIEQALAPRKVNFVLVAEEDIKAAIHNFRKAVSSGIRNLLKKDTNP